MRGIEGWFLALSLLAVLGWVACTPSLNPTPLPSPSPGTPPPTPVPLSPSLEAGRALFLRKGCANCHGTNAESLVVVNLPSITVEAVKNQARNPTGMMPSFPPQSISDEELEQIARFVVAILTKPEPGP